MFGSKEIKDAISGHQTISADMINAIQLWSAMYSDNPPWIKKPTPDNPERVTTLGLPALIASEKARMVTLEMESEITAPMQDVEIDNPDYEPPGIDELGNITMGQGSKTDVESVPTGPTERAEFLNNNYKKLKARIREQLEYGIAKGGLVIKPYVVMYDRVDGDAEKGGNSERGSDKGSGNVEQTTSEIGKDSESNKSGKHGNNANGSISGNDTTNNPIGNTDKNGRTPNESPSGYNEESPDSENEIMSAQIEFDYIQADCFRPLAFDNNGKITEAAFLQTYTDKDKIYTRVEHHILEGHTVTVSNYCFVKNNGDYQNFQYLYENMDGLGKPCELTEVPEWANLEPQVIIEDVKRPLFAYFKMPEANTIDTHCPIGVSGFSRAVNLIRDADEQYSRLLWEYEGGELAVDVDRNALITEEMAYNGKSRPHTVLPAKQQRLFRKVDLNSEDTYNVFAPALRDENILRGLNSILTRIEDITGLSRGTISETSDSEAKTATEMKILKQRTYSTNKDIQQALEDTLRDVIYIMDVYCDLYELTPDGDYDVSFEWDDSILTDSDTEAEKRMAMIEKGLTSKVEFRMWYFGETENQAKEALQKIEDEKKVSMETNIVAQAKLGQAAQGNDFSGDNNDPGTQKQNSVISDKNNQNIPQN